MLSPEEVARLLDAAPGLKYKAALSVAYGAGLRVSEVVALKVTDIDGKRMVIRVEQGTRLERVACACKGARKAHSFATLAGSADHYSLAAATWARS